MGMDHLFIPLDAYHGIQVNTNIVCFLGPDAHALLDLPKIYKATTTETQSIPHSFFNATAHYITRPQHL